MTAALSPFEADLAAVLDIADTQTRDAALAVLAKHLPGQHDQSSHGRGGGDGDVQELFERAEAGGFTYSPATGQFASTGYAVSPYPERSKVIPTAEFAPEDITAYREANADLLAQPNHQLGAWREIDGDVDRVWLDVSIVSQDRAEAERIGQEFDQVAMFDLGQGVTIDLGGTGGVDKSAPWWYGRSVQPIRGGPRWGSYEGDTSPGTYRRTSRPERSANSSSTSRADSPTPASVRASSSPSPAASAATSGPLDGWERDVHHALLIADPATRTGVLEELAKHLPGKHDQSSHGRGGGGGGAARGPLQTNMMGGPLRSSEPGEAFGPPVPRASLAAAQTTADVSDATSAELQSIMGRPVPVDFAGLEPDLAREYGEGLLQVAERYPANELGAVTTHGPGGTVPAHPGDPFFLAAAVTDVGGAQAEISFSTVGTTPARMMRDQWSASAQTGQHAAPSPTGAAAHEMGHVVSLRGPGRDAGIAVAHTAVLDSARAAGVDTSSDAAIIQHVSRSISTYASSGIEECMAEAIADVVINGTGAGGASPLSQQLSTIADGIYQAANP